MTSRISRRSSSDNAIGKTPRRGKILTAKGRVRGGVLHPKFGVNSREDSLLQEFVKFVLEVMPHSLQRVVGEAAVRALIAPARHFGSGEAML